MRLPIKINKTNWPDWLSCTRLAMPDPRPLCRPGPPLDRTIFSSALSSLMWGSTWKTTKSNRQPQSDALLIAALTDEALARPIQPLRLLEVGAANGTNAMDLLARLDAAHLTLERYFVTDANTRIACLERNGYTYFFDEDGRVTMAATDRLLIYANCHGAPNWLSTAVGRILKCAPTNWPKSAWRSTFQPELEAMANQDQRLALLRHDIRHCWPYGLVNGIKAANILNPSYHDQTELATAVRHLLVALTPGGRLLVVDNRPKECASLFRLETSGLRLEACLGPGADVTPVILKLAPMS
ncbi:conserved hypothetical protein [Desulfovibrionales bacterium]